eukprot:ANDGO_01401.mRNA.1 hypothetical protein GUITHDRAFT_121078
MFTSKQYTSTDPIDNIRIRVRLNLIEKGSQGNESKVSKWISQLQEFLETGDESLIEDNNSATEPLLPTSEDHDAGSSSKGTGRRQPPPSDDDGLFGHDLVEERVILWQEKIFSKGEIHMYKSLESPKDGKEKLYAEEIRAGVPASRCGKSLFTYVDKDHFEDPLFGEGLTDAEIDAPSPVVSKAELRSRVLTNVAADVHTMYLMAYFEYDMDLDPNSPEYKDLMREEQEARAAGAMAQPGSDEQFESRKKRRVSEEVVLCRLVDNRDGSFVARPGFHPSWSPMAKSGLPVGPQLTDFYRFYLKNGDIYEYNITIANTRPKGDELQDEFARMRVVQELAESKLAMRANMIPSEFTHISPDQQLTRLHVMGEIVSARNFGSPSFVYVQYLFEYDSESWDVLHPESAVITGSSHLSAPLRDVSLIGFPFSVSFQSKIPPNAQAGTPTVFLSWPRILFQVSTVDRLNRHRIEGYGYINVPFGSSCSVDTVSTWRPRGKVTMQMKSFLLGGSSELRDPHYVSVPTAHSGSSLAKYGFYTEPSGEIQVRVNTATQSSDALRRLLASRFAGATGPSKTFPFRSAATPDQIAGSFRRNRRSRKKAEEEKKDD